MFCEGIVWGAKRTKGSQQTPEPNVTGCETMRSPPGSGAVQPPRVYGPGMDIDAGITVRAEGRIAVVPDRLQITWA
jgi:hypothetical protein